MVPSFIAPSTQHQHPAPPAPKHPESTTSVSTLPPMRPARQRGVSPAAEAGPARRRPWRPLANPAAAAANADPISLAQLRQIYNTAIRTLPYLKSATLRARCAALLSAQCWEAAGPGDRTQELWELLAMPKLLLFQHTRGHVFRAGRRDSRQDAWGSRSRRAAGFVPRPDGHSGPPFDPAGPAGQ